MATLTQSTLTDTTPIPTREGQAEALQVRTTSGREALRQAAAAGAGLPDGGNGCDPRWLGALADGLHAEPFWIEARRGERPVATLPLLAVRSWLFGKFLVSLPYANTAGVSGQDETAVGLVLDQAVRLADAQGVKFLELRHEREVPHAKLETTAGHKVLMRLPLPATADHLWKNFDPKLRNQIRKGQKQDLTVRFGGEELLRDFHAVFAVNMRDLGTPVYGRELFAAILRAFPDEAELCVLNAGSQAVAGALLVHGPTATAVPSASTLREFNRTNANMLMYWQLLGRSIERGRGCFDFGRSSPDSGTLAFKKQWGAEPVPSVWQHYRRSGRTDAVRPSGGKFDLAIRVWKKLPLWLANRIGPAIVRAIP